MPCSRVRFGQTLARNESASAEHGLLYSSEHERGEVNRGGGEQPRWEVSVLKIKRYLLT